MLQTSPTHRMARAGQSVPAAPPVPRMSAPKVSVVMPTRNRSHCLGEAIDSIRAQTFEDWELIVVDDGSEDATRDLVHRYCVCDSRIRYMRQPHGGCARALNTGLRLARGDYLFKLDDDDVAQPNLLATCAAELDAHPDCWAANFLIGVYEGSRETGWTLSRNPHKFRNPLFHRVASLRVLKGWDEFYLLFEDSDLRVRGRLHRGWRVAFLEQNLYDYRLSRTDNATHRVPARARHGYKYLISRKRALARWGLLFRPLVSQSVREAVARLCAAHRLNGFLPSARFAHWQRHALEEVRALYPQWFRRDVLSLLKGEARFPWAPLWRAERVLWQRLHLLYMPLMRRAEAMWALARHHYFRREEAK